MHAKEMITFRQHRLIPIILLLLVIVTGALGYLTHAPKNRVVLEGGTTVFTCCSNVQSLLYWKHKRVWSQSTHDIYDFSGLLNGFLEKGRFNVTRSSSPECYSLNITDVKREDAGTYMCIDNGGLGQSVGWELIILESFNCQEEHGKENYTGVNNFDLAQDVIAILCISTYIGNMPAKSICEWSSGTELNDKYQHVTKTNTSVTLRIQMPATKEINNNQLYCYAKTEMESSENQNLTTWKSAQFRINYANVQHKTLSSCSGDELSLDCNPPCKASRISNGSQICEIAYPSHTDKKFYVLLQDYNEPIKENVVPIVTVVLVAFGVSAFIAASMGILIWRLKKKRGCFPILSAARSSLALQLPDSENKTVRTRTEGVEKSCGVESSAIMLQQYFGTVPFTPDCSTPSIFA